MPDYALFLGCTIPLRYPSVEAGTRKVFDELGISLVDLKGYSCCPDPVVSRIVDQVSWLTLAARNICLAEKEGLDIVTVCNGCYETLAEANHELKTNPDLRKQTNGLLAEFGREFKGKIDIKHSVEVLYEDSGPEAIRKKLKVDLPLKVALHYGCHMFRTFEEGEDEWKKPNMMKELVECLGCEVVDYGLEKLCCGYPLMMIDKEFALKERIQPKLQGITDSGADCVVLNCPSCLVQFESSQAALRREGVNFELPFIYLPELMALSFGVSAKELGLSFHRSPVQKIMEKIGE